MKRLPVKSSSVKRPIVKCPLARMSSCEIFLQKLLGRHPLTLSEHPVQTRSTQPGTSFQLRRALFCGNHTQSRGGCLVFAGIQTPFPGRPFPFPGVRLTVHQINHHINLPIHRAHLVQLQPVKIAALEGALVGSAVVFHSKF